MTRKGMLPPLLTSDVAENILEGTAQVSLDLGRTVESVSIGNNYVILPNGSRIGFEELRKVGMHRDAIFFAEGGSLYMVAISDDHFYKLIPTGAAPTIEVNGIRMHRTRGTTPDADADEKIRALGVEGGRVLDTCTGLGYTALSAAERGTELIVSIELRPEVLHIAELNPWSVKIFGDSRIHLLLGDSFNVLDILPKGFFDYIIHDPPRFAMSGDLYSREFYVKLHGALRSPGRLFHYIGEPGSRYRRVDLRRGVIRRLTEVGFTNIVYHEKILGVTCDKLS